MHSPNWLNLDLIARPTGIPSGEAFGLGRVRVDLRCQGIPSAEAFGIPSVQGASTSTGAGGISPRIPAKAPAVRPHWRTSLRPEGLESGEAFGAPMASVAAACAGIVSTERVTRPMLAWTSTRAYEPGYERGYEQEEPRKAPPAPAPTPEPDIPVEDSPEPPVEAVQPEPPAVLALRAVSIASAEQVGVPVIQVRPWGVLRRAERAGRASLAARVPRAARSGRR